MSRAAILVDFGLDDFRGDDVCLAGTKVSGPSTIFSGRPASAALCASNAWREKKRRPLMEIGAGNFSDIVSLVWKNDESPNRPQLRAQNG
jgi:hypothetical protein